MTDPKVKKQIAVNLGTRARQLLNDELLIAALNEMQTEALQAFENTEDPRLWPAIHADLKAVRRFHDKLAQAIANGKQAARELET